MDNTLFFDNVEEKIVSDFIAMEDGSDIHAVLIYNIDNTKEINASLGYDNTTEALNKINNDIRHYFKGTDVVIRLGFDEFVILVKNVRAISNVEKIAEKILKTFSKIKLEKTTISATIGISLYPFHGQTYKELKEKAYQALVRGKANGKNCYRVFDAALTKAKFDNYMLYNDKPESYVLEDISDTEWNASFVDICTNLLYTDNNAYSAVNAMMEMFCLYNGFERGYAFVPDEISDVDNKKLRFTLPGCEEGFTTDADIENEKALVKLLWDEYGSVALVKLNELETDSEIYKRMSKSKATELFYFSYTSRGNVEAGIIFENLDEEPSKLTNDNLFTVYEQMLKVVSYIMIYHKFKNFDKLYPKLQLIENIDACACIVDGYTYEIEFMNRKFIEQAGMNAYGKNCHDIFHNCGISCEDCPLKAMDYNDPKARGRKESFNLVTQSFSVNMFSWLSANDNKGKALLISVDADDFLSGLMS